MLLEVESSRSGWILCACHRSSTSDFSHHMPTKPGETPLVGESITRLQFAAPDPWKEEGPARDLTWLTNTCVSSVEEHPGLILHQSHHQRGKTTAHSFMTLSTLGRKLHQTPVRQRRHYRLVPRLQEQTIKPPPPFTIPFPASEASFFRLHVHACHPPSRL